VGAAGKDVSGRARGGGDEYPRQQGGDSREVAVAEVSIGGCGGGRGGESRKATAKLVSIRAGEGVSVGCLRGGEYFGRRRR